MTYWQSEEYRCALRQLSTGEPERAEKPDATKIPLAEALSEAR